jgi:hypothetical protein
VLLLADRAQQKAMSAKGGRSRVDSDAVLFDADADEVLLFGFWCIFVVLLLAA